MTDNFSIPYPPQEIFEYGGNPVDHVTAEAQYVNIIERIEYPESGGIFVYLKGALHPSKGFPTPEAIGALNLVKRILITQFLVLFRTDIKYFVGLAIFLPHKRKMDALNEWLYNFDKLSWDIIGPYLMKVERMTPIGQEIYKMTYATLQYLGVGGGKWDMTARIVSALIDYDTAYRYRVQDLLSETTKEKLYTAPITEIKRLLAILVERDPERKHLQEKFKAIGTAISILLLIPRFRKLFKRVILESDFHRLQFDEADRYHVLRLDGYQFLGRTIEDRFQEYLTLHNGTPPPLYKVQGGQIQK